MEESSTRMQMSSNEDLKKRLETIQNQLDQTRKEINTAILQMRTDASEYRKNMNENQILTIKNEFETLNANLKLSQDQARRLMKLTNTDLYFSIFVSAIIGIIGNYFITLWYQLRTEANLVALIVAGVTLVALFVILAYSMYRSQQSFRAE